MTRSLRVFRRVAAAVFLLAAARAGAQPVARAAAASADRPTLVVLIAIDQFRPDYFDRFGAQFTGGLARIRTQSALYLHAMQDHAITETAPGHSTMLSGREPVHTAIVSNLRGVPDPSAALIGVMGPGASPRKFVGTTLYDWILARDSAARVLSVSRKDRGAILPVGRARGDVYWFAGGRFTTSRYYGDTLPTWASDYDSAMHLERLAHTRWDLLLDRSAYPEPDSVSIEHDAVDYVFPHLLPSADSIAARLQEYPWMDSLTFDFALSGVRALHLGTRTTGSAPDLLSISLSTTDAVGHAYGPDSRELHDHLLRLDRWLGAFLDSLARQVPAGRMLLVLTSDDGVTPFPELAVRRTGHGGRLWLADIAAAAERQLEARYHTEFSLEFDNGLTTGDTAALRARGVDVDSMANALAATASQRGGVLRAYTPRTLAAAPESDTAAVRWRRTIPHDLSWITCAVAAPGFLWSPGRLIAEHGTPHPENVAVPIAFMGPGIQPGRFDAVIRTVDIAPTLAALLGLTPSEALDGHAVPLQRPMTTAGRR